MARPRRLAVLVAVLVAAFALARGPLHRVTWSQPVSNDDAILLLMARHILQGELATTLWNQPYNGALDAYLLAPGLAVGHHHAVFRLYELLCAALLVLLAGLLARRVGGPAAGWAAALLAAWGTPYMALMTATGPPPNFLMPLVTGFPLLVALRSLEPGRPSAGPRALLGLGLVCGLAVWNSSLAIPAFAGMAAGLVLSGLRPRLSSAAIFTSGAALGASPLLVARLIGASGSSVSNAASAVTAIRPRWLWGEGVMDLAHALRGLTGLQVPLVVDGPERADLPALLVGLLAMGLVASIALGAWSRRALPLLGWAGALAGAFWLSRRTGPDELRYLYGLNAPALALAGVGLARAWAWRREAAVALGLLLLVPWGWGSRVLTERWSDPAHGALVWQVPPIDATIQALKAQGVRSTYASLQFAGRITLESEGDVVASQAWNERIPGDPLRFRDEVDLDPDAAWTLSPVFSRGMPREGGFRALVESTGGAARETPAGPLVIFRRFQPPYDEARPVPPGDLVLQTAHGTDVGSAVFDRDPETAWTSPVGLARGAGVVLTLPEARRLSALVLLVDLDRSPLAVPWVASLSGPEGAAVVEGPIRNGLQWIGGVPRAGRQGLLVVPLGGANAHEVRLVFQGSGPPLSVAEAFLYGPDEEPEADEGAEAAERAFHASRSGSWDESARLYTEAWRASPERASYHAAWARARWRAARRRWLDVEGLGDGGPEFVKR